MSNKYIYPGGKSHAPRYNEYDRKSRGFENFLIVAIIASVLIVAWLITYDANSAEPYYLKAIDMG